MEKRSCLAAECFTHKLFLGVEGRGVPEGPATTLTFPSGATNDVFPPLWIPTHTTIEPPSHTLKTFIGQQMISPDGAILTNI